MKQIILSAIIARSMSVSAQAQNSQKGNYGIDLLKSDDLILWTSVTFDYRKGEGIFCDPKSPSPYKDFSTINRVWASQIFWNPDYTWENGYKGGYMIIIPYSSGQKKEERNSTGRRRYAKRPEHTTGRGIRGREARNVEYLGYG